MAAVSALAACSYFEGRSIQDVFSDPTNSNASREVEQQPLMTPSSIVVCRSRQCAPAKLTMSREYVFNSLLHLFDNNNYQKALVCQADPASHVCLENYITLPIVAGIAPTNAYIDYVKITDVIVGKGGSKLNLILNYNLTFGGQTPDCTPSKSILFAKNVNHVLLEDGGYTCKMTAIGQTTVKTVFAIDYIDLDYGYIGGYYSIGLSGPAYGGGSGYMILRLPKDAYPLAPELRAPKSSARKSQRRIQEQAGIDMPETAETGAAGSNVQVFPINR